MKKHRIHGTGLDNVFLLSGYEERETDEGLVVSYRALDSLYATLAQEVAEWPGALSGKEFRFLRKRLAASQEEAAAWFGKSAQAVAKWEKGSLRVPEAESKLLKLFAIRRLAPYRLEDAVQRLMPPFGAGPATEHVFTFENGQWVSARRQMRTARVTALSLDHFVIDAVSELLAKTTYASEVSSDAAWERVIDAGAKTARVQASHISVSIEEDAADTRSLWQTDVIERSIALPSVPPVLVDAVAARLVVH